MRQVRFSAAMSLDGFIAGPRGEIDWIARDQDFDFNAYYREFDAALVGRKTYGEMRASGKSLPGMKVFVLSQTLSLGDCTDANLRRDATDTIAEIRALPGKDIWIFGGATLFSTMLELGLVDSVELSVSPVLLGAGIRLRPFSASPVTLKLTGEQVYPKSGMIRLEYALERPSASE